MIIDDLSIMLSTGKMKSVTDRLDQGKVVPLSEILDTTELKLAQSRLNELRISLRNEIAHKTGDEYDINIEKDSINTLNLPAKEVAERKHRIIEELDRDIKSAVKTVVDGKDKWVYNGNIKNEGRIDIVLGLPASGKSSTVVNPLSEKHHSRIIDNDEAKKKIEPWYDNGFGADLVHEESKDISDEQMTEAMKKLENLVIPKVGGKESSIYRIIRKAVENNYQSINLHYVEVPREVALSRLLKRLVTDNRFLDPKLIYKYDNDNDGNRIEKVYNRLKERSEINEYSRYNNNVGIGEEPKLIEMGSRPGLDIRSGLGDGQVQIPLQPEVRRGDPGGEKRAADKGAVGGSGTGTESRTEKESARDNRESRINTLIRPERLPDSDEGRHKEADGMGEKRPYGRIPGQLREKIQGKNANREISAAITGNGRQGRADSLEGTERGREHLTEKGIIDNFRDSLGSVSNPGGKEPAKGNMMKRKSVLGRLREKEKIVEMKKKDAPDRRSHKHQGHDLEM